MFCQTRAPKVGKIRGGSPRKKGFTPNQGLKKRKTLGIQPNLEILTHQEFIRENQDKA